jgi:uncharacterized membrane protein
VIAWLRTSWGRWSTEPASLPAALATTTLGLLGAYLLKVGCVTHAWADAYQYRRLCYNDIQPLFAIRGIQAGLVPYADVQLEYPPLTGMFMDGAGKALRWLADIGVLGTPSHESYFQLSAVLLAPFAFALILVLRRHTTAARLAIVSVGTPMVLYAFHNWDLIAVALGTAGLVAFERGRQGWSGAALSAGASAKLYPAFFYPAMAADRLSKGDRAGLVRLTVAAALVFAVINVPWVVAASGIPPVLDRPDWAEVTQGIDLRRPDTNGWVGIWTYHAGRYPDFGTVWYWIAHHGRALMPSDFWRVPVTGQTSGFRDLVSISSLVLFLAGVGVFLVRGLKRHRAEGTYPVMATSLGIDVAFQLVSKVHSPQYALWLAPLLALLNVRVRYIAFYFAADLAVFISGFYWFTVMDAPAPAWQGIFEVAVLARAAALGSLAYAAWGANRRYPLEAPKEVAHEEV